jgi:hypothetical protein
MTIFGLSAGQMAMPVRETVEALVAAGPLPSEDAPPMDIEQIQRLLEQVAAPVSDAEAHLLAGIFGPDNCFGLSWTLLHLIETAPGARTADYSIHAENEWIQLLRARQAAAAANSPTSSPESA